MITRDAGDDLRDRLCAEPPRRRIYQRPRHATMINMSIERDVGDDADIFVGGTRHKADDGLIAPRDEKCVVIGEVVAPAGGETGVHLREYGQAFLP